MTNKIQFLFRTTILLKFNMLYNIYCLLFEQTQNYLLKVSIWSNAQLEIISILIHNISELFREHISNFKISNPDSAINTQSMYFEPKPTAHHDTPV